MKNTMVENNCDKAGFPRFLSWLGLPLSAALYIGIVPGLMAQKPGIFFFGEDPGLRRPDRIGIISGWNLDTIRDLHVDTARAARKGNPGLNVHPRVLLHRGSDRYIVMMATGVFPGAELPKPNLYIFVGSTAKTGIDGFIAADPACVEPHCFEIPVAILSDGRQLLTEASYPDITMKNLYDLDQRKFLGRIKTAQGKPYSGFSLLSADRQQLAIDGPEGRGVMNLKDQTLAAPLKPAQHCTPQFFNAEVTVDLCGQGSFELRVVDRRKGTSKTVHKFRDRRAARQWKYRSDTAGLVFDAASQTVFFRDASEGWSDGVDIFDIFGLNLPGGSVRLLVPSAAEIADASADGRFLLLRGYSALNRETFQIGNDTLIVYDLKEGRPTTLPLPPSWKKPQLNFIYQAFADK